MYTAKGQLDRDALIRQHLPLVRRLATHMMAKLPPNVELDDLVQLGMIGLTEALSRYEASQGVQFETFATQRIRGAMLDELRNGDWMSRSSRKGQKDIERAIHRLEQTLGRSPLESEIAQEMGMELQEYQQLLGKVRGTQLLYLEDLGRGSGNDGDDFLDRHLADQQLDPASLLRSQNLARPMIGGRQSGAGPDLVPHNRAWLALLFSAAMVAFAGWYWQDARSTLGNEGGTTATLQAGALHNGDHDD